jgi:hypothetical protein
MSDGIPLRLTAFERAQHCNIDSPDNNKKLIIIKIKIHQTKLTIPKDNEPDKREGKSQKWKTLSVPGEIPREHWHDARSVWLTATNAGVLATHSTADFSANEYE